jgi:hypothetical protein
MAVGREFRRLRMRRGSMEYVGDGLAFRGSKACNIDQRFDPFAPTRSDDGPRVRVTREYKRPIGPLRRPIERGYIVR